MAQLFKQRLHNYKVQAEACALSLKLQLYCTDTDEIQQVTVTFKSIPTTVLDIKRCIEKQHNVPVCIQVLSYEGHTLNDGDELSTLKTREGDTFHVKYLAIGNCTEINRTIKWMRFLQLALDREGATQDTDEDVGVDLWEVITILLQEEMIEDLAFKYFFPWLEPVKYVNKLHFVYNEGVQVMMKVYETLLQVPWKDCMLRLKYIEYAILRVLWNLTETFPLRRLVIKKRGIKMCIQSMLRAKLQEGTRIEDLEPLSTPTEQSILVETIAAGLGALCNLSELPESHLEIASNEEALDQLTCISLTPSVRILSPQLVATLFLCLAYTPQTHKHITKPIFVRRLLDAYKIPRTAASANDDLVEALPLLKYFTMVFLAQVALVSSQHIPHQYQQQITNEMDKLFDVTDHKTVMECEIKHWYVWSTFLPYIKLAFIPRTKAPTSKLQLLSLQLILFALQNMLGRENHRQILLKEGLLDYVVCMPQYVPPSLRAQAEELVQMVVSSPDIPEGPPRLLNLVKARLAKMRFGLEQVLSLSVSEIVSKTLLVSQGE